MICKLCEQKRPLIKAHAIPEAFFRVMREGGETPILVSSTNPRPKRAPIGVYDKGILCLDCERSFTSCDAYAIDVLLNQFDALFRPLSRDGQLVGYVASNLDQKLLQRFMIATVWRASVSTHPFYKEVGLGTHEEVARRILVGSGDDHLRFETVLSRWRPDPEHTLTMGALMSPFRERWDGRNSYRFYFGQTIALIKADRRPFESPWNELRIGSKRDTAVLARDFDTSHEFASMKSVARSAA